jgi:hypothetical protein
LHGGRLAWRQAQHLACAQFIVGAAAVAHLHAACIDGDQHGIALQRDLEARAQHGDLYVCGLDHEGPFRVARHDEGAAGQQPHLSALA